jgi:ketosteroid isomerase-like protein
MKHHRAHSLLAALMPFVILGCRSSVPTGLTDADKAAIRKRTDAVVSIANASTKDWDAYVRSDYTEDAVVLPPNSRAVQGWDAIKSYILTEGTVSDFKVEMLEIEGRGDLAYVRGTYSMTATPAGASGPTKDTGKYIEIWRKQADGSWKVIRDIFNSDLPTQGAAGRAPVKSPLTGRDIR